MKSKKELLDFLDENVKILREKCDSVMWGNTYSDYENLIDKAIKLKEDIVKIDGDEPKDWVRQESRVYKLEAEINKFIGFKAFLPNFFNIYLLIVVLLGIFMFFDIPTLITEMFGIEAPEKILSYSLGGALIYFASNLLSDKKEGSLSKVIVIRVVLAVTVPLVLVSLLFSKDGNLQELSASPELISFLCGYSAKLIIDFLTKLVEKGQQMIAAI